jgi:hypothetical protein
MKALKYLASAVDTTHQYYHKMRKNLHFLYTNVDNAQILLAWQYMGFTLKTTPLHLKNTFKESLP